MGAWTDVAAWAGPIPNCGPGAMSAHIGVVIHTAEGSYDGTIAWQRNPAAQVGSHFVTATDGRCVQLIDTGTRSWCQSAGNDTWISIENQGFGSRGESLSAQQVEKCAQILARANQVYGVPLQVSNSPSTPGLGWHGMGGNAWGGHFDCPGNAIRAQLPAIVARAAQIAGGNDVGTLEGAQAEALQNAWKVLEALRDGSLSVQQNTGAGRMAPFRNDLPARLKAIEDKLAAPAPAATVAMTDADRQAIIDGVAAKLSPLIPTAAQVASADADEEAKRLSNG